MHRRKKEFLEWIGREARLELQLHIDGLAFESFTPPTARDSRDREGFIEVHKAFNGVLRIVTTYAIPEVIITKKAFGDTIHANIAEGAEGVEEEWSKDWGLFAGVIV